MKKKKTKRLLVFGIDASLNSTGVVGFRVKMTETKCFCRVIGELLATSPKPKVSVNSLKYKIKRLCSAGKAIAEFVNNCEADKNHNEYAKTIAIIEGNSFGSHGRLFDIGEMGWEVKKSLFVNIRKRDLVLMPPKSWKKIIIGNGNAQKAVVMKNLYKKYGYDNDSDDLNDAFAIGMSLIYILCGSAGGEKLLKSPEEFFTGKKYLLKNIEKREVVFKQ